jgi:hypothetical protein
VLQAPVPSGSARFLLEIGGGIGVIGAELAGIGLASATLVEASPAYLGARGRRLGHATAHVPSNSCSATLL